MTHILGISGSLRAASTNTVLLEALSALFPENVQYSLLDGIGDLPIFNPDCEGELTPAPVLQLARKIEEADGLIVSSPEYVHGIPGGLKNVFDWLVSRPEIIHKPILLLHASHRGDIALAALRDMLATLSSRLSDGPVLKVPLMSLSAVNARERVLKSENAESLANTLTGFLHEVASAID